MSNHPNLRLRGWFREDELDECPACGERSLLRGIEMRYCLSCGEVVSAAVGASSPSEAEPGVEAPDPAR